jgi:dTDP-4-amino-4,6-dideoxygalactose transaminase
VELATQHAIQVRTMHAPPLHHQPAFAHVEHGGLAVTDALSQRALALPMANHLPDDAYERIQILLQDALSQ